MYGYYPGFPLSSPTVCALSTPLRRRPRRTCAHDHRTRTAQLCLCGPLQAPVVPGSVRVIWCIDNLGCVHPRSRCKCQYECACILPPSFSCCTFPFLPRLLQLRAEFVLPTSPPYSNSTPRVFYTT